MKDGVRLGNRLDMGFQVKKLKRVNYLLIVTLRLVTSLRIYAQSTGFETLIGWLFLKDPKRLSQLMTHLEKK